MLWPIKHTHFCRGSSSYNLREKSDSNILTKPTSTCKLTVGALASRPETDTPTPGRLTITVNGGGEGGSGMKRDTAASVFVNRGAIYRSTQKPFERAFLGSRGHWLAGCSTTSGSRLNEVGFEIFAFWVNLLVNFSMFAKTSLDLALHVLT